GSVSGTKWNDLNNTGVFDGGEPGLSGVTVFVDYNDNGTLDGGEPSTTTLANGTYTINNVTPGSYIVREVVPAGFTQTSPGNNGAILDQPQLELHPLSSSPTPLSDAPL